MLYSILLQVAVVLAIAPLVNGINRKVKAALQGRRGAGILQPYHDLVKLMRKDSVVSETTSWIFSSAPYVAFAAMVVAALLVPVFMTPLPLALAGDLLALVYLFAIARFFVALAALDAGSSFGGMGSSREMTLSALAEPALLMSLFVVAISAGSTSLSVITGSVAGLGIEALTPPFILAFVAFLIIVFAETGRIPFDNPATHLELTMIHEAMILEYSGKQLALIEWGSSIKQFLLLALAINVFFPWGIAAGLGAHAIAVSILWFLAKLTLLSIVIAVIESATAKWRLFRVPNLLVLSLVLSIIALISYYTGGI